MPPSRRDDIVTDVLDHVTNTLSGTKSLLDLVPVPGLSAATDVLLAILGQIKVRVCTQIAGGTEGLRSFESMKTMRVNKRQWWLSRRT